MDEKNASHKVLVKEMCKVALFSLILATLLFISAGRFDWPMAWAYIGIYAVGTLITSFIMIRANPDMHAERIKIKDGVKKWDTILGPFVLKQPVWMLRKLQTGLQKKRELQRLDLSEVIEPLKEKVI